ncbi:MAG: phosphotransferase [Nanoarchaeota archaeon]|nr:phosphotransferase [Nanoarchaeota archaeon]
MGPSLKKIKELSIKSGIVKDPIIKFLAEGNGNYNYIVEEDNKKYVFRIKKSTEKQFKDSLEKEYSFLKYFENEGINFCPKVIYYSKNHLFLMENFLEGTHVSQKDFTDKQIDTFASQLWQLFNLDTEKFHNFCKSEGIKDIQPIDPLMTLNIYGFNRFELVKNSKYKLEKKIIDWIEINLNKNKKYLEELKSKNFKLSFSWGDIQSKVIINSNGLMQFYDFEHAQIYDGPGLSYIKIHGKFSKEQFKKLVESYSKHSNRSLELLNNGIKHSEKIIRVNDVIWAAMKWATTGKQFYMDKLNARIPLADKILD